MAPRSGSTCHSWSVALLAAAWVLRRPARAPRPARCVVADRRRGAGRLCRRPGRSVPGVPRHLRGACIHRGVDGRVLRPGRDAAVRVGRGRPRAVDRRRVRVGAAASARGDPSGADPGRRRLDARLPNPALGRSCRSRPAHRRPARTHLRRPVRLRRSDLPAWPGRCPRAPDRPWNDPGSRALRHRDRLAGGRDADGRVDRDPRDGARELPRSGRVESTHRPAPRPRCP